MLYHTKTKSKNRRSGMKLKNLSTIDCCFIPGTVSGYETSHLELTRFESPTKKKRSSKNHGTVINPYNYTSLKGEACRI